MLAKTLPVRRVQRPCDSSASPQSLQRFLPKESPPGSAGAKGQAVALGPLLGVEAEGVGMRYGFRCRAFRGFSFIAALVGDAWNFVSHSESSSGTEEED